VRRTLAAVVVFTAVLLTACSAQQKADDPTAPEPGMLRVLASSELADMAPVLDRVRKSTGIKVRPTYLGTLARAVRQDVPETVDTFVRTRWWTRLAPGQEPPEHHLERQLTLVHDELKLLATTLRETEARRQESHTRYLEDRGREQ